MLIWIYLFTICFYFYFLLIPNPIIFPLSYHTPSTNETYKNNNRSDYSISILSFSLQLPGIISISYCVILILSFCLFVCTENCCECSRFFIPFLMWLLHIIFGCLMAIIIQLLFNLQLLGSYLNLLFYVFIKSLYILLLFLYHSLSKYFSLFLLFFLS